MMYSHVLSNTWINRDVPCCTVFNVISESYTAMYSNVPCMVYKYPFSYIKVYTFLSLYIEVHRCIYFRAAWVRSPPTPTHKTCLHSAVGDFK
jgi:hypothetical protein